MMFIIDLAKIVESCIFGPVAVYWCDIGNTLGE